jgi:hypothetical protein
MHHSRFRERRDIPSLSSPLRYEAFSVQLRIRQYVEHAVLASRSAASLARHLHVTPASVSQWRTGRRIPAAVHLIRIQDLANSAHVVNTRRAIPKAASA